MCCSMGLNSGLKAWGLVLALAWAGVQAGAQTAPPTPRAAKAAAGAVAPDEVVLSFRDAEISDVASVFGTSMGTPFILDSRVKGKITLESPQPVPLRQAFNMFVSALSLQGFAVVEQDGFSKILPAADAKSAGVGVSGTGRAGAGGSGLTTRVFRLQEESATQVMSAIRALVPAANPITAIPQNNSLVVTDSAQNIAQIAKLIGALDKPQEGFLEQYSAKHMLATDLAAMVDRLVNNATGRNANDYAHLRVQLLPSARTNDLMIYGPSESQVAFAADLARQLDTPTKQAGNVHVVYLKHAEATALANTLQGIFQVSGQVTSAGAGAAESSSAGGSAAGRVSGTSISRADGKNPATSALSSSTGDIRTPEGAVIRAEPSLNALIVVAPEAIYRQIRAVIDRLDVRRAQVYIESLIVEVSADRAAEFGVQFQYLESLTETGTRGFGGTNFGTRSGGISGNLLDISRNPTSMAGGLNLGVLRGSVTYNGTTLANLGLLARALETQGAGNVIATPNLLTLDNEEARITIGQNVPFITGSYSSTGAGAGVNPFQTIERKDVGTTLRVKPTVTDGGTIKLQIFQEVSSVTDTTLAAGLITNRRAIESQVLVDDEQIIVLGGLIEDREVTEKSQVPLLGNIPLFGALFRYDTTARRKTNLLVFLRPVILRTPEDSNILSVDRYDAIRKSQKLDLPERSFTVPDFGRKLLEERGLAPVKPKPANPVRGQGD